MGRKTRWDSAIMVGLALLALLLLSGSASAGSRGNPEVTDHQSDTRDYLTAAPVTVGVEDLDVVAAWFDEKPDRFEVHWRVRSLIPTTSYRTGTTAHRWDLLWETNEGTWNAQVVRDSLGGASVFFVTPLPLGPTGTYSLTEDSCAPGPLQPPIFDDVKEEITATLPRSYDFTGGIAGPASYDFIKGTNLTAPRVVTWEGLAGTDKCGGVLSDMDGSRPGRTFEFGTPLRNNANVRIRPVPASPGVPPGGSTSLTLTGTSTPGFELVAPITASIDRPGWTVVPESFDLLVPATGTARTDFTVTAPADAKPGDLVQIIFDGGDIPVAMTVAVGDEAAKRLANGLERPNRTQENRITRSLFLQSATQSQTAGADQRPVFPGNLIEAAPRGTAATPVRADFAPGETRRPYGTWIADPSDGVMSFSGTGSFSMNVTWTDLNALRLLVLIGADPLPIDWAGAAPPPGTRLMASTPGTGASGAGVVVASGDLAGLRISPGDRLAVSVFVDVTGGQGAADATIFSRYSPSNLTFSVETPDVLAPRASAVPGGPTSAIFTGVPSAGRILDALDWSATVTGPGGAVSLAAGLFPITDIVGTAGKAPVVDVLDGSFAKTDAQGARREHPFKVDADVTEVGFLLTAPHSSNRFADNNLDLEIYRVVGNDRTLVKAARSYDADEELLVTYDELERTGRGDYVAVVVLNVQAPDQAAATLPYELTITDRFLSEIPDAFLEARFLWSHASMVPGNYTIAVALDRAAVETTTSTSLALTTLGPTIPPVAAFSFEPALPSAGESVRFTDTSSDADGRVTAWSWDTGDGSKNAAASPTHTFLIAGTFIVALTVTDDFGAPSTAFTAAVTVTDSKIGPGAGGGAVPGTGTIGIYKDAYEKGLRHDEAYFSAWRQTELDGSPGKDYLAGGTRQAYFHGTVGPGVPFALWSGGSLSITNLLGAITALDRGEAVQSLGESRVRSLPPKNVTVNGSIQELQGLSGPPSDHDDASDGLLKVELSHIHGTLNAKRTLTFLEGTLHGDVRNVIRSSAGDTLHLTTETIITAPSGSWLAYASGETIHTVLLAEGETTSLTFDAGNGWFAVYRPADVSVAGVVFSGDTKSASATLTGALLRIRTDYEAVGSLLSAQYLLTYAVADTDATRYAGVMEIARQDGSEIGIATLADDHAAAVGWAGARSAMEAGLASGLTADWDALNGFPKTWNVKLEAPSSQGGKPTRLILPAKVLADGGVGFLIDGVDLSLSKISAMSDDVTLIALAPIDHFSVRNVQVRSIVPGLPPIFLWATLGLGAVVSAEALTLARQALGSGGESRGATRFGGGTQSAAVRRALGYGRDAEGPTGSTETREVKGIIAGERERMTSDRLPSGAQSEAVRKALGMDPETQAAKAALLAKLAGPAAPAGPAGPHLGPATADCSRCNQPITFANDAVSATCAACGSLNTRREA